MPRTSRPLQIHPIVLRRAEVVRVVDVSPNLRRLTLAGPDLSEGEMGAGYSRPEFRSDGFDDHVKLVVPGADGALPRIGTQEENRFAWNPEVLAHTRDYTVRSWEPGATSFEIDVVRHEQGLAADWAFAAQPGDEVHFAGPKSCALRNDEVDWHLLVGDETALPAISRWLEEAPEGTRGQAIIEVPSEADRVSVPSKAEVEVTWLVRGRTPAGTSTQLADAVRRLVLPEGRGYAWVAGEALTIAPIRRHLRHGLGLPKEDVEVSGYWRRAADQPATEPADDAERLMPITGDDEPADPVDDVHEMSELLPPVVTRVAVTLGICSLIADGHDTAAALARETAVAQGRLVPLLDALAALGLVEEESGRYRNTARGGVLTEESAIEHLSLDDPANREALALVDLLDVLRTGVPAARLGGLARPRRRATDAALDLAHHERAAEELHYVLEPLAALAPVAGARTLAVYGDAAGRVADALAGGRAVHLPGDGEQPWPQHDCAVLVGTLEGRDDEEGVGLLRAALTGGTTLVLVERTSDRAATDDHDAEDALVSLVASGLPLRSGAAVDELLRRAGAVALEHHVLGWGFSPLSRVVVAHV
ncbi:siderophore-interacting protein [Nocardioides insulae]|uniref:siderophore-interacting protein n=1 Tax=Nocardioides insulae TaxID=394734 RepID=UPI0004220C10|nr:siderophore-interacting protein [Nocardioides insulae]